MKLELCTTTAMRRRSSAARTSTKDRQAGEGSSREHPLIHMKSSTGAAGVWTAPVCKREACGKPRSMWLGLTAHNRTASRGVGDVAKHQHSRRVDG